VKFVFFPPTTDLLREWASRLRREVPDLDIVVAEDAIGAMREVVEADAGYGSLTPELLAGAKRLRWLQAHAANPSPGFFSSALLDHPVQVTNMRGVYNDHIATHILAFILAFARGLHHFIPQQCSHTWRRPKQDTGVVHLPGSTLLIIGMGGIGQETGRLAAGLGITVIGTDSRGTLGLPGITELHPAEALDALLPRADFVVLTVPHTPATEYMMDLERFRLMKPGAFFINIGRGKTTRLDHLVTALKDNLIAGAGLDVFDEEPLPQTHLLWSAPNVLLTPHTAGFGPFREERRFNILLNNCRSFLNGMPLQNLVDKASQF
jgi:phosphoglycerate dehydrogenase-like enzyme